MADNMMCCKACEKMHRPCLLNDQRERGTELRAKAERRLSSAKGEKVVLSLMMDGWWPNRAMVDVHLTKT